MAHFGSPQGTIYDNIVEQIRHLAGQGNAGLKRFTDKEVNKESMYICIYINKYVYIYTYVYAYIDRLECLLNKVNA